MVLIPYLLSALFMFKLAIHQPRKYLIFIGAFGSLYGFWLIYAGGVSYLLLSMILYSVGLLFYLYARKQRQLSAFSYLHDKIYAIAIVVLAIIAIVYFYIIPH